MTSLSRKIRHTQTTERSQPREAGSQPRDERGPQPREAEVKTPVPFDDTDMDEINIDEKYFDKIKLMFICDIGLTSKVQKIFNELKHPVSRFKGELYTNVPVHALEERGISTLWINLRDKGANEWVSKNANPAKSGGWKIIAVSTTGSQTPWVGSLKEHCCETIDLQKLKRWLKALSFDDFIKNLDNIDVGKVPNKLLSCLGIVCGGKKKDKF